MAIKFTQFLLPNGERREILVERPTEIEAKADKIIKAGFKFECEVLATGMVSVTISDPIEEEDVAIQITPNGTEVNEAIDRMINGFDIKGQK